MDHRRVGLGCPCAYAECLDTGHVTAVTDFDGVLPALHLHGINTLAVTRHGGRLAIRHRLECRGVATVFQETQADLREKRVSQHVIDAALAIRQRQVFFAGQVFHFTDQAVHLVVDQIRRATGDGLVAVQGAGLQLGIEGRWGGAVFATQYATGFLAQCLVAFAGEHIEHRLGADDLGGGRDQGNKAQVFAYRRNFLQHFVEAVGGALLFQLAFHVGKHAARHLGHQDARIHAAQAALEFRILLAHFAEVASDTIEFFQIQAGVTVGAFQHGHHGLGGAVAVGHGHGRDGGVHIINAGLGRFQCGGSGQPGGGMALHVHRNGQRLLEAADQLKGHIGTQQAGHVLDGHGVGAHLFDHLALLYPHIQGMHRADSVGDGALCMFSLLDHGGDGALDVAHVVHGIEHPEHVHAVFGGAFHKGVDHIVGVVAVAQQVLSAQQHLLRRVGHGLFQLADTLPGVFAQITDAGIKGGAAPGFQGPESNVVQFCGNGQHVVQTHACGEEGLMRVAQHHIGDAQRLEITHGKIPVIAGTAGADAPPFQWP